MNDRQKKYELTFEERPRYLFARIKIVQLDQQVALDYLNELADTCRARGFKRLMLDRQIPMTMSDAENYLVILEMIKIFGPIRLAIVNPYLSNEDALKFGNLVGENRGLPYLTFNAEADAEAWLLKDDEGLEDEG